MIDPVRIREQVIDDLIEGEQVGRFHLTDIISDGQIELDPEDLANLITGSTEHVLDVQSRLRKQAMELVIAFVDGIGQDLVTARIESAREDEDENNEYSPDREAA